VTQSETLDDESESSTIKTYSSHGLCDDDDDDDVTSRSSDTAAAPSHDVHLIVYIDRHLRKSCELQLPLSKL